MRKYFYLGFISFWLPHGLSAQADNPVGDALVFSRTQIGLNFTGSLSQLIVLPQTGPNEPQSAISPGFEGTICLNFNFDNSYGLGVGIGGGYQNYNYTILTSYDQYGVWTYSGTGSEIGYLTLPIEFLMRKQIRRHLFLFGGAGFSIRLYDTYNGNGYTSSGDSTSKDYVKLDEIISSGPRILMIPRIDLGLFWQLPYKDLIKIGLSFDVGEFAAYTSSYTYLDYNKNNIGSGSYMADASFVGLNIGYVFNRIRHKSNIPHSNY